MAPSTLRKAIGAVKDQTSIGIAKVSSSLAPQLEVVIVKATSHDEDPASEKYIREILNLTSYSRGYVHACISSLSRRLGKTRDWIVALKALMLLHRLLTDGDSLFHEELLLYATRRGTRLLNMSDFRDEAHSSSWDHSAFVRTYSMYLDQRLELMLFDQKSGSARGAVVGEERMEGRDNFRSPPARPYDYECSDFRGDGGYGNYGGVRRTRSVGDFGETVGREGRTDKDRRPVTPLREMKPERIFRKMGHLQRLMDRFLSCRPTGLAKNCRMVLIALYPAVRESFQLYADICEVLALLLDKFFDFEYTDCVKAVDMYASAAKQVDELVAFYVWCKDKGVARSSEYPEVQRITTKLLETLEEFVRDRAKRTISPDVREEPQPVAPEEEPAHAQNMNEIRALPPPENYTRPPPVPEADPKPQIVEDLVNLKDDTVSADDQGNRLVLALFAGPPANSANGSRGAFPANGQTEVTSAWQTPAAEPDNADWELALVETASNLAKQKAALGGGLDPLILNGMYDQGIVRQHASIAELSGGSASSVALAGHGKTSNPVLALPAPDGTVETYNQDPFAASLNIPPPSYVQMADMEKKQTYLVQEQQLWLHYARDGMQGQSSLTKLSGLTYYGSSPMPTMPPVNGIGSAHAPYYYASY